MPGFNRIDNVEIWGIASLVFSAFGGNAWSLRNLSNFWKVSRRIWAKNKVKVMERREESKSKVSSKVFYVYVKKNCC